jgi:hypothetical protein
MVSVVRVGRASAHGNGNEDDALASASVIRVADDAPFAPAWNKAMAATRSIPGVARSAR